MVKGGMWDGSVRCRIVFLIHCAHVSNLHHDGWLYQPYLECCESTPFLRYDGPLYQPYLMVRCLFPLFLNLVYACHRLVCGWFLKIVSVCIASVFSVYWITPIIKLSLCSVLILFQDVSQLLCYMLYICICVCLHVCACIPEAINN